MPPLNADRSNFRPLRRAAITAVSLLTIGASLPNLIAVLRARSWPVTNGTITAQRVANETLYWSQGRSSGPPRPEAHARLYVEYAFTVNGQSRTGSHIRPYKPYVVVSGGVRDRYAVGTPVSVHYDPDGRREPVIDASIPWIRTLMLGLGFLGLGWIGLTRRSNYRR